MTITVNTITLTEFNTRLRKLLGQLEDSRQTPYHDNATGNDTYILGRGYGTDTILENGATSQNTDIAKFCEGIAIDQLWFCQSGNDLEVSVIGTGDKFSIGNCYLGNQHHVEQFKTSDGKTLLDSQVQNLVQAMAGFAPPVAGQTSLPANYASALAPTLVANWH